MKKKTGFSVAGLIISVLTLGLGATYLIYRKRTKQKPLLGVVLPKGHNR